MRKLLPWILAGLFGLGLLYEMVDRRLDQAALAERAYREAICASIGNSIDWDEQVRINPITGNPYPVPDPYPLAKLQSDLHKYGCLELK